MQKSALGQARQALVDDLVALLGLTGTPSLNGPLAARHAFAVDVAGLTTTADWFRSNADIFSYVKPDLDLRAYFETARKRTTPAVTDL